MTDRIVLHDMRFQGHHGQTVRSRSGPSRSRWTWSWRRDLRPGGRQRRPGDDDRLFGRLRLCASIVEARTYRLLEAIAEAIAARVLATFDADEIAVRVRKPAVRLSGPIGYAGVEMHRRRSAH